LRHGTASLGDLKAFDPGTMHVAAMRARLL